MSAEIIDGRACARRLKASLTVEARRLREDGVAIGLAVVIVGDDFGSVACGRRLRRLASEMEVRYLLQVLPVDIELRELISVIARLNAAPDVAGILVLRPLPGHIDEAAVFQAIVPEKDIEAIHPENAGLLALGVPRFIPSTAASVFHLLDTWLDSVGENRADFYHSSLIVVVGRSNNVGKPAISLGYDRQAAVESVDEWASKTVGLGRYTRRADVFIVAAGRAGLIKAEHISDNAVVIDVGINPLEGPDGGCTWSVTWISTCVAAAQHGHGRWPARGASTRRHPAVPA